MKKIIGSALLIVSSILLYNYVALAPVYSSPTITLLFYMGIFFVGAMLIRYDNGSETIKTLTRNVLGKHHKVPHIDLLKIGGDIENNQKFCSLESDTLKKDISIFGYDTVQNNLRDLSYLVGKKRKTTLYDDFRKPTDNWVSELSDIHKYPIIFVVTSKQKRKLLSYDKKTEDVHYREVGLRTTVVEVYSNKRSLQS
mgnify:CR=1 FL=1